LKAALLAGLLACSHARADVIPADATALLVATTDAWDATKATLQLWKRSGSAWTKAGDAWSAVIGKRGAAWGAGLHGDGPAKGEGGPVKKEGDGRSPAGAFALDAAYGYAPSAKSGLPYTAMTASLRCVDDPKSRSYARIVNASSGDWSSAETMKRDDALYTWVVDVAHNRAHVPGAGSCIFLHVWSGPDAPTVGCTAMPEEKLRALLPLLDAHTVFVLLPKSEYAALAKPWGLP
jgi:L,D-peptidoglycan transpeptidase YkuD (ErfK/YbiS/YcfS/YnhG family)